MLKHVFGTGRLVLAVALSSVLASGAARADGCEDMKQLCKEATAKFDKCMKTEKDEKACKALVDVRDATCTQVELVCKPAVGEPD